MCPSVFSKLSETDGFICKIAVFHTTPWKELSMRVLGGNLMYLSRQSARDVVHPLLTSLSSLPSLTSTSELPDPHHSAPPSFSSCPHLRTAWLLTREICHHSLHFRPSVSSLFSAHYLTHFSRVPLRLSWHASPIFSKRPPTHESPYQSWPWPIYCIWILFSYPSFHIHFFLTEFSLDLLFKYCWFSPDLTLTILFP